MASTSLSRSGFTPSTYQKYDDFLVGNAAYDPSATFFIQRISGGGQSSVTFSSIPQTYKHIQLRMLARDNSAVSNSNNSGLQITFNSVTTSTYDRHYLEGSDGGIVAGREINNPFFAVVGGLMGGGATSNAYAGSIIDIHDYTSTAKNKTLRMSAGGDANVLSSSYVTNLTSGLWRNTSAITSITLTNGNGSTFSGSTTFALYGMLG